MVSSSHRRNFPESNASWMRMPGEITCHILRFDPHSVCVVQTVSRRFKQLGADFLRVNKREILAQCFAPVFPLVSRSNSCCDVAFHLSIPEKIRALGVADCTDRILPPEEVNRFNQTILQGNLQRAWSHIHREILAATPVPEFSLPEVTAPVEQIAPWIQGNPPLMQVITHLDLSHLHLTCLPKAIGLCTNLRGLSLHNNRLSFLPPGVFDQMAKLERLYLFDNALSVLPSDIFHGLTQLQKLFLFDNQLETLPPGLFSRSLQLREILLSRNDLKTLPPKLFDGLFQLDEIRLNCNQLSVLPPALFDGLPQLRMLGLQKNPLLIPWTDVAVPGTGMIFVEMIDQFFSYRCASPLAAFYQRVAGAPPPDVVKSDFDFLDEPLKSALSRQAYEEADSPNIPYPQWKEEHLFDDMQRFHAALKKMVRKKFEDLPKDQRKAVYDHAVALSCTTASLSGILSKKRKRAASSHPGDTVLRLIDAMMMIL